MKLAKNLMILFCTCWSLIISGQDIHFSQAYASPLSLNPAATGNYDGQFRLICNYKDQWRNISKTYKTIFASADFVLMKKKKKGSYLGLGILFSNDKAGKSKLGTTNAGLALAYSIRINKVNFFSVGLQSMFTQRSINTTNLKWDNQFDGNSYDPLLSSGETDYSRNVNYMDYGAGLLWTYIPDVKNKVNAGISILHVNKPAQAFSKSDTEELIPKITVHADANIKLEGLNLFAIPIVYYSLQGKQTEINGGGMIKYGLGLDSKYTGANKASYLSLGALYRVKDAIIILVNMEYKDMFKFGLSYDVNISSLSSASKGKGGMELCIIYSGFFNKSK